MKNIFFFRNYAGNEVGRLVPERFSFLKKDLSKKKASDQPFSLTYFSRPRLGHTIKTNFITFQAVYLVICSILILCRRVWD